MPKWRETHPWLLPLVVIAVVSIVPWLGLIDFNTKGEPREAIVAWTMLDSGNWILPQNIGGEFAYKPPMLHWLVAAFSSVLGGVSPFTSRLPSALAAIVTALATYLFFAKRRDEQTGFVSALVFLTTFEVHRAAEACRVDMVLTMFIVLALYGLYRWAEQGLRGVPLWAIVWMGCGTLTKGPVAIVLPCLVVGVLLLLKGRGLWAVGWRFVLVALGALVLPALWYFAAYQQGGDRFAYLVYEENVLRFIGKMPYRSHENGPFYYVVMLIAGLVPYTILLVCALFGLGRAKLKEKFQNLKGNSNFSERLSKISAFDLFVFLAVALILLFYTIPKSKRGVYILPVYPFVAYYIARLMFWLRSHFAAALRVFFWVLCAAVVLAFVALLALQSGSLPAALLERIPEEARPFIAAYATGNSFATDVVFFAIVLVAIYLYYRLARLGRPIGDVLYTVVVGLMMLDALILPPLLNQKSDRPAAALLEPIAREGALYQYVEEPMMHFFTLNFYLENRAKVFNEEATAGALLIGEADVDAFRSSFPAVQLRLLQDLRHRSCDTRQNMLLFAFERAEKNASPQ